MKGDRLKKVFKNIEEAPLEKEILNTKTKNLKGMTFNNLKVIHFVGYEKKRGNWLCQCSCKKYVIVNAHNLQNGHTKSCGCLISEKLREDLTGKQFGLLKAIKYDCSKHEKPYWQVECLNCGKIYSVDINVFRRKDTQYSCGCIKSKREEEIAKLLNKYSIPYKREVSFTDLLGRKNQKLRFDFGIYDDQDSLLYLIEHQGVQHYEKYFLHGENGFEELLHRDKLKKQYCADKKIPLIEITYKDELLIDKLLLFKTKGITDEVFNDYCKPSMLIANSLCKNFKCNVESGITCCQNSDIVKSNTLYISYNKIIIRYLKNKITRSIVFGGLENFDEFNQLYLFISIFRNEYKCYDPIVIYTGYYPNEIKEKIDKLKEFNNIIIKFGRYVPNETPHFDPILGVILANKEQWAEKIC